MAIQPVKAGGKHAFKDEDILAEMENVRVKKVSLKGSGVLEDELVQAWTEEAKSDSELDDCNADITYTEVRRTFDSGSNTPGLDVVTATMIAKADSVLMMECSLPNTWKLEHLILLVVAQAWTRKLQ